MLLKPKGGV